MIIEALTGHSHFLNYLRAARDLDALVGDGLALNQQEHEDMEFLRPPCLEVTLDVHMRQNLIPRKDNGL